MSDKEEKITVIECVTSGCGKFIELTHPEIVDWFAMPGEGWLCPECAKMVEKTEQKVVKLDDHRDTLGIPEQAEIGLFQGVAEGMLVAMAIPLPEQNKVLLGALYKVHKIKKGGRRVELRFHRDVHSMKAAEQQPADDTQIKETAGDEVGEFTVTDPIIATED